MNQEQLDFIEEFGVLWEQSGGARMVGRVLGALLISDPPERTAEELAELLDASRGSISQSTRLLVQLGMVKRISKRGERRDYFRVRPDAWTDSVRRTMPVSYLNTFRRGLALMDDASPESRAALEESVEFMSFLIEEMESIFRHWDERKGRQR